MTDLPGSLPETSTTDLHVEDDHGAALERSADAIREARDAEGGVAAHGDITSADADHAGEASEDPDGQGGTP